MTNFDTLAQRIRTGNAKKLVVVGAHESNVLKGVARAAHDGIADPVLLGDQDEIEKIAENESIDLTGHRIVNVPDIQEAALIAMEMVRGKEAGALMKGKILTADLMRIGIKNGLRRDDRLLSHIVVYQFKNLNRLISLTDSGIVPYPTLKQRVQIIKNAVETVRFLGVEQPNVAALASSEEVDEKFKVSVDAKALSDMNKPGGELEGWGKIDGPIDLFSALDAEAAKTKGIISEIAGKTDILHCPDVVAGNLLAKAIIYFSKDTKMGGCVVGGSVPLVLLSRASKADDKYYSILLGLACSPDHS